jgi:toxin ParE1/3/4
LRPQTASSTPSPVTSFLLAGFPYAGCARENDLGSGTRSFPTGEHVIVYAVADDDVLILRVLHGRRDLESLFDR